MIAFRYPVPSAAIKPFVGGKHRPPLNREEVLIRRPISELADVGAKEKLLWMADLAITDRNNRIKTFRLIRTDHPYSSVRPHVLHIFDKAAWKLFEAAPSFEEVENEIVHVGDSMAINHRHGLYGVEMVRVSLGRKGEVGVFDDTMHGTRVHANWSEAFGIVPERQVSLSHQKMGQLAVVGLESA